MTISPLVHRFVCLAIAAVAVSLAVGTTVSAQQAATYEVVSTFDVPSGVPTSVIQMRTGQFYGTTSGGPPRSHPRRGADRDRVHHGCLRAHARQ